jgi:ribosomal protein L3
MQPVLIVQKGKTTQKYDERTRRIPVTQLTVTNLSLADIKTQEKDGYDALKLTSGTAKRIDKPTLGTRSSCGCTPYF